MEREVLSSAPWCPVPGFVGTAQSCVRQGRVRPDRRKHFFTERVAKPWHRLPGEVVNALCLSVSKRPLDDALNAALELLVSPEVDRQLD